MPKISLAIPYHQTEKSAFYLSRLLKSIDKQTFTDYEIVLTNEPGMAHNHNVAILKSKGEIIQMMQMDDYFSSSESLKNVADGFHPGYYRCLNCGSKATHGYSTTCDTDCVVSGKGIEEEPKRDIKWQITACLHDINGQVGNPHIPQWTDDIYTGNNRLGSISTLSFRRDKTLLFEEPLTWLVDVDLYYRLSLKYGLPNLLQTPNVVIQERPDRLSNTLSEELKASEVKYLKRKYHHE